MNSAANLSIKSAISVIWMLWLCLSLFVYFFNDCYRILRWIKLILLQVTGKVAWAVDLLYNRHTTPSDLWTTQACRRACVDYKSADTTAPSVFGWLLPSRLKHRIGFSSPTTFWRIWVLPRQALTNSDWIRPCQTQQKYKDSYSHVTVADSSKLPNKMKFATKFFWTEFSDITRPMEAADGLQGSWLLPSFLVLINDLSAGCSTVKYVDDSTLSELLQVQPKSHASKMTQFLENLLTWTANNHKRLRFACD